MGSLCLIGKLHQINPQVKLMCKLVFYQEISSLIFTEPILVLIIIGIKITDWLITTADNI